jgi:hypothetical protein
MNDSKSPGHSRAARDIPEEYFDSDKVLTAFLEPAPA